MASGCVFIAIGLSSFLFFSNPCRWTRQRGTVSVWYEIRDSAGQNIESFVLAPQSQGVDLELRVVLKKAHTALAQCRCAACALLSQPTQFSQSS